ncbi:MAG: hypothetical protein ACRDJ9_22220, partial [Dehalococcoidia bacterium]
MDVEDASAAGLRVQPVREARLHTRGLIQERQRARGGRVLGRQTDAVLLGLQLDTGKGGTFGLCFDRADRLRINKEQVVRFPIA